jgi:hypothetical protein
MSAIKGKTPKQRKIIRDKDGLIMQYCFKCDTPKYLVDFHIRYRWKYEPYNRDTVCNKCMNPVWNKWHQNQRDRLKKLGLSSRGRVLGLPQSRPWVNRSRKLIDEAILGNH